jgi:hypothetical protein
MRESPACAQWHSPLGLMMKAAIGAVRLLLGRDGRELDDQVRLLHHLLEHGRRVVVLRRVAVEQLPAGHHHLVGRLASAAASAHAVGRRHRARSPLMRGCEIRATWSCWYSRISLVDAGRGGEAVTLAGAAAHGGERMRWRAFARLLPAKDVLSIDPCSGAPLFTLDSNLHSPERRLIELRMEHADLDALIDRAAENSPWTNS